MTRQQAPARRCINSASDREQVITAYVMLIPALVISGISVLYPIVAAAYMSLTSWDGFSPEMPFVGLDNYLNLAKNPKLWNSLIVTVIYAVGVSVLSVLIGLIFVILLDAFIRGRGIHRTIYLPLVVISSVVVATVWKYTLDDSGLVNNWLGHLGITGPNQLQNRWIALAVPTLLTVWKNLGFNIVLCLTVLQGPPHSVFEVVEIDGVNKLQQIRFMTVPPLHPMTSFVVVQALINSFQAFGLVYVLTEGGPCGGTDVLGMMIYRQAFRLGNSGYGTAISLATLVLALVVTLMQWKFNETEQK